MCVREKKSLHVCVGEREREREGVCVVLSVCMHSCTYMCEVISIMPV